MKALEIHPTSKCPWAPDYSSYYSAHPERGQCTTDIMPWGYNTKGGSNGHSNHVDRRVNASSLSVSQGSFRHGLVCGSEGSWDDNKVISRSISSTMVTRPWWTKFLNRSRVNQVVVPIRPPQAFQMHHHVHNLPSLWNDRLVACNIAMPQRVMSEGPAAPSATRTQCQW